MQRKAVSAESAVDDGVADCAFSESRLFRAFSISNPLRGCFSDLEH
jgi:hypothetical protein